MIYLRIEMTVGRVHQFNKPQKTKPQNKVTEVQETAVEVYSRNPRTQRDCLESVKEEGRLLKENNREREN